MLALLSDDVDAERATTASLAVEPTVLYCEPNHIASSACRVGKDTDDAAQYSPQKVFDAAMTSPGCVSAARDAAAGPGSSEFFPEARLSCTAVTRCTICPALSACTEVAVDNASSFEMTPPPPPPAALPPVPAPAPAPAPVDVDVDVAETTTRFAIAVHGEKNSSLAFGRLYRREQLETVPPDVNASNAQFDAEVGRT